TVKKLRKIMVADDDPAILDALTILLEDEGYDVQPTVDSETVPRVKQYQPDILLLDIWMSGVNGGDICKELKNEDTTSRIPVIMISANRDTAEIAKQSG